MQCRLAVLFVLGLLPFVASAAPALIRYPNVAGQTIVFVARDTLWTVPLSGGTAHRIEGVPGTPSAPRFSPDGKWIAFTATNQGNQDVYVVPAAGGAVRRLTWAPDVSANPPPWWGPNNLVVGWSADASSILFLSRTHALTRSEPVLTSVPVEGGLPTPVDLNDAAMLSFSPDGSAVAYSRTFAAFRPWKSYNGGLAPDIFVYRFNDHTRARLTDWQGTDDFPMWHGKRIYFLSDRDAKRRANLWVMDEDGSHPEQLTHFSDYDVDFPSLGGDFIAFQEGGKLWLFDTRMHGLREVRVDVPDDGTVTAAHPVNLALYVRSVDVTGAPDFALSPDGNHLAISALGHLTLLGPGQPPTWPTQRADADRADEDHPAFSPDGREIAYVSDESGEEEVMVSAIEGGAPRSLTHTVAGYYYRPVWSADGSELLVADAGHGLWLVPTHRGVPIRIALDPAAEIRDGAFSADGKTVVYSTLQLNQQRALHLFDVATRKDTVISSSMNSDRSGQFSADGRMLFFLSNRHTQPVLSDRETDMVAIHSTGVYAAPVRNSDVQMQDATALPLPGGNLELIGERGGRLFILQKATAQIESNVEGETSTLHAFDSATGSDTIVLRGAELIDVASDGRHVAYRATNEAWHIRDVVTGSDSDTLVGLGTLDADVAWPHVWREMLDKAWRLERDMFVDAGLDGARWRHVHDTYDRLLPLVSSHADFNYLLGQLQGEVESSHTYFGAPADPQPHEPEALLGADLELDARSGLYRIRHILEGDNSKPLLRSPLRTPGIDVKQGDYLISVNGRPLHAPTNPEQLLAGLKGSLQLGVASSPSSPVRTVVVDPLSNEALLRQNDWIQSRRQLVDALSGGRVAYIYLANMNELGTRQFIDQFYPQQDKKGLVIDVRWNTGGFTSQLILERLRRIRVGVFVNRQGARSPLPDGVIDGPKAVVVNHYSASDGDQFPYFFREYGLGPVVGTRTWGGVRGILGAWPLMDGSSVNVPKDVLLQRDGKPLIENVGTVPDMDVDNDPVGDRDPQLERAVQSVLKRLGK